MWHSFPRCPVVTPGENAGRDRDQRQGSHCPVPGKPGGPRGPGPQGVSIVSWQGDGASLCSRVMHGQAAVSDCPRTVVPVHPGRIIKEPLLRAIIRDASLSAGDFIELP